jgi:uncharacterized protein YceK
VRLIFCLHAKTAKLNLMPMKKVLCLLIVALLSGCSSIKTVSVKVTEPRPAISANDVHLMLSAPTNGVLLADIYVEACCASKKEADAAQMELKKEAAAVGANALVIQRWEPTIDYSSVDDHFRVEANAYFIP